MKLYRNITLKELHSLLVNKEINPNFNNENSDSTYTNQLGKVTCWFTSPYVISRQYYDFIVFADVEDDKIIGEGVGEYARQRVYEAGVYDESKIKEVYTYGYSMDDVTDIYLIDGLSWNMVLLPFKQDFDWMVVNILERQLSDNILEDILNNLDVFQNELFLKHVLDGGRKQFDILVDLYKKSLLDNLSDYVKEYDDVFPNVV